LRSTAQIAIQFVKKKKKKKKKKEKKKERSKGRKASKKERKKKGGKRIGSIQVKIGDSRSCTNLSISRRKLTVISSSAKHVRISHACSYAWHSRHKLRREAGLWAQLLYNTPNISLHKKGNKNSVLTTKIHMWRANQKQTPRDENMVCTPVERFKSNHYRTKSFVCNFVVNSREGK
jgi:hypothetical protein